MCLRRDGDDPSRSGCSNPDLYERSVLESLDALFSFHCLYLYGHHGAGDVQISLSREGRLAEFELLCLC